MPKFESKKLKLIYIAIFATLLWGTEYSRRALWEPDEARYAYVAGEMRENGQWAVPHRNGEIYGHKPPLMFWAINIGSLSTGGDINRISARLPSLLGVILSLWAAARLAALWRDNKTAWRTVAVLSTSYLFWKTAGMGQIDSLLCGLEMSAIYLLLSNDLSPGRWRIPAAYLCMGLAVISKGPVGFIIPLGVYLSVNLAAGEKNNLRRSHWIWGWMITLAVPILWLTWAWLSGAGREYFDEIIFKQNVGRAGGSYGHRAPFYYYAVHFPLEFIPWIIFLPAAIAALYRDNENRRLLYRLAGWTGFVLLFFSIPLSKRNLYVLAAYPATAIMVAAAWDDMLAGKWRYSAILGSALFGIAGVGLLTAPHFITEMPIAPTALLPTGAVLATGSALLAYLYLRKQRGSQWLYTFFGTMLLTQLSVAAFVYPALNPLKTPVAMSAKAKELVPPGQKLLLYRMYGEIQALYAQRRGRRIDDPEELKNTMIQQGSGVVVGSEAQWKTLPQDIKDMMTPHYYRMGHKKLVWGSFPAADNQPR